MIKKLFDLAQNCLQSVLKKFLVRTQWQSRETFTRQLLMMKTTITDTQSTATRRTTLQFESPKPNSVRRWRKSQSAATPTTQTASSEAQRKASLIILKTWSKCLTFRVRPKEKTKLLQLSLAQSISTQNKIEAVLTMNLTSMKQMSELDLETKSRSANLNSKQDSLMLPMDHDTQEKELKW